MKQIIVVVAIAGASIVMGCSQESRDEAIERATKAAKELNGSTGDVPKVVAEQQRKEKVRQNTKWTVENQCQHPVEYCQAQLEEIARFSKQLDVQAHEIAVAQAEAKRVSSKFNGQVESLSNLLSQAKQEYRKSDANEAWPMTLNGYQLSKEKAQQTIVETFGLLQKAINDRAVNDSNLRKLETKAVQVEQEQKKLVLLKDKVQATISDLRLKKLVDGKNGIVDALNAINDTMNALAGNNDGPTVENLLESSADVQRKEAFDSIMAQ